MLSLLHTAQVRCLVLHKARVNELSIDAAEEYIASCSDDGSVYVMGLCGDLCLKHEHGKPIKVRISECTALPWACGIACPTQTLLTAAHTPLLLHFWHKMHNWMQCLKGRSWREKGDRDVGDKCHPF